jgi:hypothetical protein
MMTRVMDWGNGGVKSKNQGVSGICFGLEQRAGFWVFFLLLAQGLSTGILRPYNERLHVFFVIQGR